MNRNFLIAGVILILIAAGAGVLFLSKGKEVIDVSAWQDDETGLGNWANDIAVLSQDDAFSAELDQIFNDIAEDSSAVGADKALNEASIAKEAGQADFDQTLSSFAADDEILRELDQSFGEVLQ